MCHWLFTLPLFHTKFAISTCKPFVNPSTPLDDLSLVAFKPRLQSNWFNPVLSDDSTILPSTESLLTAESQVILNPYWTLNLKLSTKTIWKSKALKPLYSLFHQTAKIGPSSHQKPEIIKPVKPPIKPPMTNSNLLVKPLEYAAPLFKKIHQSTQNNSWRDKRLQNGIKDFNNNG